MAAASTFNKCIPCTKSELDLASIPPTQTAIVDSYTLTVGSKNAVSDDLSPLEFEITGSSDDYLDLSETYLCLQLRLVNQDGSDLQSYTTPASGLTFGAQKTVVPANLILHSLFQNVDLSFNDTLVSSSSGMYGYRAQLTTLLSYGYQAKKTWLEELEGWYDDEKPDDASSDVIENTLIQVSGNSRSFKLRGRLHVDMCLQERLLPTNVNVRFVLTRAKPEFCINSQESGKEYKVVIQSATMEARRVKVAPEESIRLEKMISTQGARYNLTHVLTKNFTISSGVTSVTLDSLLNGQLPNKIYLAMVDNDAFTGTYSKSPFNYKH